MVANSRKNAFLIHLGISVIILMLILSVIFFVWFPNELIYAGGIGGLKIIMFVDLVLGPLLTLIVFKPKKKNLKFDLICIGVLQIGCLVYGLSVVYSQRPLLQVTAHDGVYLLSISEIKRHEINLDKLSGSNLKRAIMDLPEDQRRWNSIAFTSEVVQERPFSMRDDLYVNQSDINSDKYNERLDTIIERSTSQQLYELNKSENGDCRWVPVFSAHTRGFACVTQEQGVVKLSNKEL